MPTNVAIYARVSTSDQDCAMQLDELKEYCSRRKWSINSEYIDEGWSGRKSDRPALNRLLYDAQVHAFDAVLVWKLDRFGRSVADLTANIQRIEKFGIRFIAVSQGIDTDQSNPTSRLLMNMLAAIAEFEAEIIRERVKAGVEHAKRVGTKSGNPIGRPARVFRRDEVIRLRSEGKTVREIARQFKIGIGTVMRTCTTNPSPDSPPANGTSGLPGSP
jgi:putative DNA-invertase from lambdoid prophage Rac